MPTLLNLAPTDRQYAQTDPNAYNKYSVYFGLMQADEKPNWDVWGPLTGDYKWTPNMGSLLRVITPERSPVTEQQPQPNNVTSPANRNVYAQKERTEDARVKHHKFESDQIHWLGPWQDVRSQQLDPLLRDITRQQAIFNNHFIRMQAFQRAPNVMIFGNDGSNANLGAGPLVGAPNSKDNADAVPKTAAFLQACAEVCKGVPSLQSIDLMRIVLKNDLGATPMNGAKGGTPVKNDLLKGTYGLVFGDEAWNFLKWTDNVNFLKALDADFVFKTFQGRLFGTLDTQCEQYPLRMLEDGTFPAPEIEDDDGFVRPNPSYISAPFEWGFGCGDGFGHSIEVGPPPSEFGKGSASAESGRLVWNGKPFITGKFLVKDGAGNYELNETYGEFRKIIAKTLCGYVPGRALNMLPFLYKRARVAENIR